MKAIRHSRFSLIHSALLLACSLPAMSAQMTDYFKDRPQITGATAVLTADTASATLEPGEQAVGNQREDTVWAEWIAPANGWVTIDTLGTTFALPMVTIYSGESIGDLSTVARAYDPTGPTPASASFPVTAGAAYQIMLDSSVWNASGPGKINIRFIPGTTPDSHVGTDAFEARPDLTGSKAYCVAANHYAGMDAYEPDSFGGAEKTIWWQWTAPTTGTVTLDTLASDFDTVIAVYAGNPDSFTPFAGLGPIAYHDNIPNSTRSRLSFQTQAGRTYQIAVDASPWNDDGNIVLNLDLIANSAPAAIPGTDAFANRGVLSGVKAAGVACNLKYSIEAFEPDSGGFADKTAWWEWTAPEDCDVTLDTNGSSFDTSLKVFEGSGLESLVAVSSNNNVTGGTWSRLTFGAKKGTKYQIVVDSGIWSQSGNIVLNLNGVVVPEVRLAPEIAVQQPVGSNLVDDRTKKSFGTVRVGGKSVVKTFTIRNTGTAPLTGLSIGRSGAHAGDFFVGKLAASRLAPGASTTFKVTFFPKARGTRTATLLIRSNDADENPFGIPVTGLGVR